MKEFMFYIRNAGDAKAALSPADHLAFVKECEQYISTLTLAGKLIAAQPIMREGVRLSKAGEEWMMVNLDLSKEVQVGYYHILASSLEEAVEIAKANPEFAYVPSASIEIHQVKTKEEKTNFVYPT